MIFNVNFCLFRLSNKLNVEEAAAGVVVWAEKRKMNIEVLLHLSVELLHASTSCCFSLVVTRVIFIGVP